MKKIIRLNESQLNEIVKNATVHALNEMGTPKQNAFLKKLMGNRYDPKYDRLSVTDTSRMIDNELAKQREDARKTAMQAPATDKQIEYIANNKYYPMPQIRRLSGKLTKEEASVIIDSLNPYDGVNSGGYSIRTGKHNWFGKMENTIAPILRKYGLDDVADDIADKHKKYADEEKRKRMREEEKQLKEYMDRLKASKYTLYMVSAKDDDNISNHRTSRLSYEVYMDGVLEEKIGYDIPYLVDDMNSITADNIEKTMQDRYQSVTSYDTIVLGYNRPCTAVFWFGIDNRAGKVVLCGRVVDKVDASKALHFAWENAGKAVNAMSIS